MVYSGATVSGTIVGSGGEQFVNSVGTAVGTVVSNGGTEYLISASTFGGTTSGTVVSNGGREIVESRSTAVDTVVSSGGTVIVDSGGTAVGAVIGSGGEELLLSGGTASGSVVHDGGIIDVSYLAFTSGGTADLDSTTDILTVTVGGETYMQQLSGSYAGEYFQLTNDGSGGTMITEEGTPCYCKGTLIRTDRGDVAVENLRIGDRLVTCSGAARPIRWIGMRSYGGRFAQGNKDVLPILIRQGALGECVPKRDLWVSPLHAMYLDGVLIPAFALINGVSIVQAARVDRVDYFHVELESHDVIVAEGAWSESFADDDSRGMFHNATTYRALYPGAVRTPVRYCAPRLEDGEMVETIRFHLAARARVPAKGAA
jgi:autotransporter passenger strand-loop-strand repeat protein